MSLLTKITIQVPINELLPSIWYSHGSGASGRGVGIDDHPESFRVSEVRFEEHQQMLYLDLVPMPEREG